MSVERVASQQSFLHADKENLENDVPRCASIDPHCRTPQLFWAFRCARQTPHRRALGGLGHIL